MLRKCNKCLTELELTEDNFYRRKTKDGFQKYCIVCQKKQMKKWWEAARRTTQYNLGEDGYNILMEKQKGACAICLQTNKILCIDHCHVTGLVRGLLCRGCNVGIGYLQDNSDVLQRASEYIKRNKPDN